jgi:hypothetical protein
MVWLLWFTGLAAGTPRARPRHEWRADVRVGFLHQHRGAAARDFLHQLAGTCLSASRRFKTSDDSRNSLLLALLTLGEGWHNNHHRYAASARQGFYWWEIDVSYYLLKLMSWAGLIWDLKAVPASVYREDK